MFRGSCSIKKKYPESTPLAILSYEESAKASWLLKNLEKKKGITEKDWQSLLNHDFKLGRLENENKKMIEDMSEAETKIYLDFQQEITQNIAEKSKRSSHKT